MAKALSYPTTNEHTDKCFAFIIPVRNPLDKQVKDYRVIEALLEKTVASAAFREGFSWLQRTVGNGD